MARPHLLCEDTGVIGTAFYVMDFVPGRVFWEPYVPGVTAPERAAIYDSLNATLAHLHKIDIEDAGLSDFGRPAGYVQRQVKRWAEQYRASRPTRSRRWTG